MRFEELMTTLCYARVWYTADHCASCYALTHTRLGKRELGRMQKITSDKMPTTSWLYQRRYTFEIPI